MREFSVTFKEGLNKGIHTQRRSVRGEETLVSCYNLKPSPGGLMAYEYLSNPTIATIGTWPFPQLFIGQDVRVLADSTKIYELTNWALGTAKLTVTAGERWEFIDFGPYLILTNGLKLCIRDYDGAWTSNDYLSTMPRFSTGCNFNGQIVAGNIKSTWHGCGTGHLAWSRIGSVDFTPGGDNEAGFRGTPWEGAVLRVKKLGKGVVVYCENGIGVLLPFEQTFGWTTLSDVGLDCKGALDGNENIHVFVGNDRNVYRINRDFKIELLGYYDQFSSDAVNTLVVQHNPLRREFHICGDGGGYVLTEQGLAGCFQRRVSTVVNADDASYGVFTDNEDYTAYIITDQMDFGLRGLKTIQTIEVAMATEVDATDPDVYVTVLTRYDKNGDWITGPTQLVNPQGVVTPTVTGADFAIVVYFNSYTDVEIDYLNIRIKLPDKRYIRGEYNVAKNVA